MSLKQEDHIVSYKAYLVNVDFLPFQPIATGLTDPSDTQVVYNQSVAYDIKGWIKKGINLLVGLINVLNG